MTPSQPIDDRIGSHHSCWIVTGSALARDAALDSKPRGAPILSSTAQPAAARLRLHQKLLTSKSLRPPRPTTLPDPAAIKSP
jgi:hypothetical protein